MPLNFTVPAAKSLLFAKDTLFLNPRLFIGSKSLIGLKKFLLINPIAHMQNIQILIQMKGPSGFGIIIGTILKFLYVNYTVSFIPF